STAVRDVTDLGEPQSAAGVSLDVPEYRSRRAWLARLVGLLRAVRSMNRGLRSCPQEVSSSLRQPFWPLPDGLFFWRVMAMNASQKFAWFTLGVISLAVVTVLALFPVLGRASWGGCGLLGFLGFSPLFFLRRGGKVLLDERDGLIWQRSLGIA